MSLMTFLLTGCGSDDAGGPEFDKVIYGTTDPASFTSFSDEDNIHTFMQENRATGWSIRWREENGNIIGRYTGPSGSFSVSGTTSGAGRVMTIAVVPAYGPLAITKMVFELPAGTLSGAVTTQFKAMNSAGTVVHTQTVYPSTTSNSGGSSENDSDGDSEGETGGTGGINDFKGFYKGSLTEVTNLTATGMIKYCSMVSDNFRMMLSPYAIMVFRTGLDATTLPSNSDLNGEAASIGDFSAITPDVTFNKTYSAGYPSNILTSTGVNNSGVKYFSSTHNGELTFNLENAKFSGTTTKKLTGTFKAKVATTTICEYTLDLTKE